jgi:hypothetical protein
MTTPRSLLATAVIVAGALESKLLANEAPVIIHVFADGTGNYETIQDAVDNATPGAIVRIGAGTRTEAVTVTQPLTLEGSGWEVSRVVSASAGQKQASPELIEGLQQISRELDAETQAKVRQAFLEVFGASPVVTVKDTERVIIRNMSLLRSEPVREGAFTSDAALEIVDANVHVKGCAILESPGAGVAAKGDSRVQVKNCLIADSWGRGVTVTVSERGSFEIAGPGCIAPDRSPQRIR